ncbi:MAG: transposase, partial [Planctomycetes bacterium]|nr:transposase [Planctomycetota bacterium]
MRHDIEVIHGTPYYPQGRGKLERFHRTLELEILQGRQFSSLKRTQAEFDPWRRMYNHERPHE